MTIAKIFTVLPQVLRKAALSIRYHFIDKYGKGAFMMLQLNPSILVETPLGRGHAIFLIDYGMHQNTCWVVALETDGVVKHFDCNDIIIAANYTYGINLRKNTNHD